MKFPTKKGVGEQDVIFFAREPFHESQCHQINHYQPSDIIRRIQYKVCHQKLTGAAPFLSKGGPMLLFFGGIFGIFVFYFHFYYFSIFSIFVFLYFLYCQSWFEQRRTNAPFLWRYLYAFWLFGGIFCFTDLSSLSSHFRCLLFVTQRDFLPFL